MRSLWLLILASCSGAPFTLADNVQEGDADVFQEASPETTIVDVGPIGDAGRASGWRDAHEDVGSDYDGSLEGSEPPPTTDARGGDAPSEAQNPLDVGAVADAVLESEADRMTAEASTPEACTPPASFTFGCGPPIYVNAPTQYCVLNQIPNTAQAMQNPCACEYDCACLVASGARLCPGGENYQSCSIGTTGGMVVVCK